MKEANIFVRPPPPKKKRNERILEKKTFVYI